MKREYAKVFLYAYPWLGALSEAMAQSAENKALLSYRALCSAEEAASHVVREYAMQAAVTELAAQMERVVASMDDEEKYLLEYKYFRRADRLAGGRRVTFPYSVRTYFRKQAALAAKVARLLEDFGWTDRRFAAVFGQFSPFMKILRALREGKERMVWEKRKRGGVAFAGRSRARPAKAEPEEKQPPRAAEARGAEKAE